MAYLKFSELGKQRMIDQLLDYYNRYTELYQLLGDTHFKEEAERTLLLLHQLFSPKSTEMKESKGDEYVEQQ